MTLPFLEIAAIAAGLGFLFLISLVEGALIQSSPLTLRMILEREEETAPALLKLAVEDELQLLVPIHAGTQLSVALVAILATHLSLNRWQLWGLGMSFVSVFLLSLLFRQLLPRLLTQTRPEEKLVRLLRVYGTTHRFLRSLSMPVSLALGWSRRVREDGGGPPPEPSEEVKDGEIQAYLDIGEDEGILEEEDSRLIQSVVEFGDTVVREVMTPRTKIVSCEESASLKELRQVMVDNRHSRIPLYRGELDHITGIAYIRPLFARYSPETETRPASEVARPALFIPETKPVALLLREFQERGENAAIVVDEFGGVSGLVTMEDLLEEIVGEIRDEDQAKVSEVLEEGPGQFLIRGSTELYRLEEISGRRLEGPDYSTIAGLVAERLGRVPVSGEEFEIEGLQFRIVDADRRRVHRVRVRVPREEADSPGSAAPESEA